MKPQFYKPDLAYVHDVGFGTFADRVAPGVLNILQDAGVSSGLVIDLGCGSGRWARRLTRAGFDVLGFDVSSDMIALARQCAPKGVFRTGSFLDAEFPECVAITALGEVFNYTFDKRNSRTSLKRLFSRAFRALRPGGLLIFDVAEPGRNQGVDRRFWTGSDWACLTEFRQDDMRQRLTRHITTFRKVGRHYRRAEETHVQQLYKASQLADELRAIGFRVRVVRGYKDFRFAKAHAALIATKPG
jgi:SAM-dependent methyltransferase